MAVLIVEGVTGTGKSSTVRALEAITPLRLFDEDATFGEFMAEFDLDRDAAARHAQRRMENVLDEIEAAPQEQYLIERFHFSQLALGSDWKWYEQIDRRCAALGCKVVVLTLPPDELASRCLYRVEYEGTDWQSFIPRYGSEAAALNAISRAQQNRIDAVERSLLDHRFVDTSAMDWAGYAADIAGWTTFCVSGSPRTAH